MLGTTLRSVLIVIISCADGASSSTVHEWNCKLASDIWREGFHSSPPSILVRRTCKKKVEDCGCSRFGTESERICQGIPCADTPSCLHCHNAESHHKPHRMSEGPPTLFNSNSFSQIYVSLYAQISLCSYCPLSKQHIGVLPQTVTCPICCFPYSHFFLMV